jgi:hypothetical protein
VNFSGVPVAQKKKMKNREKVNNISKKKKFARKANSLESKVADPDPDFFRLGSGSRNLGSKIISFIGYL